MVKFFGINLLRDPKSGGVQILEEFQKMHMHKLKFQEESSRVYVPWSYVRKMYLAK